jgi:hypothetical protein
MAKKKKRARPSEKTYRAIGRFIFEFSQLEYEIRHQVAEAVDIPFWHFNEIMVHDFTILCNAALSVFKFAYTSEEHRWKKMEPLLKKALGLGNIRNAVAHGLWVPFVQGGKVIHVPRSMQPNVSVKQAETLEKKADEARAVRIAIAAITDEDVRVEYKRRGRVWR